MNSTNSTEESINTYLDALQAVKRHLATIKGRVEILLLAGCPGDVTSDLTTLYKTEQEISQIVRSLTVMITQSADQGLPAKPVA